MGGKDQRGGGDMPWWGPFALLFLMAAAPFILAVDVWRARRVG